MPPSKSKREIILPILCDMFPRADGSIVFRPRLHQELTDWVSIRQAVRLYSGQASIRSVYRLIGDEFLVHRKPLKGRIEVSTDSIYRLRLATNDPEFWERRDLQEKIRRHVQQEMRKLAESSLQ
jgi:hypothetical protein